MTVDILHQIVAGCERGARLAQKRLYEHFFGRMMGVCMRYSSCREEAVEILNMGFYKAMTNVSSFTAVPNGNVEAWIYRIMVNTAIDHIRVEARHKHEDLSPMLYATERNDVLSAMTVDEIMSLVHQLPPAYRTVFNLYVVEGHTHPEIAAMLGITDGTSKSNLAKARVKLQQMIAAQSGTQIDKVYETRTYTR
jgi:RNA polymerase sigma factor (sigma-70 family)